MTDSQTLAIVKDIVTIVGILIAGCWAAWRWSFGERLRRRREMAAPDGGLSITEIATADVLAVVTVHATWRNRGPVPIELCREHTRTEVIELRSGLSIGPIDLYDQQKASLVFSIEPWWKTYIMEPLTESVLQEHIVLKRGEVYAFRHVLCLAPGSLPYTGTDTHFECIRDSISRINDAVELRDGIRVEEPAVLSIGKTDVVQAGVQGGVASSSGTSHLTTS